MIWSRAEYTGVLLLCASACHWKQKLRTLHTRRYIWFENWLLHKARNKVWQNGWSTTLSVIIVENYWRTTGEKYYLNQLRPSPVTHISSTRGTCVKRKIWILELGRHQAMITAILSNPPKNICEHNVYPDWRNIVDDLCNLLVGCCILINRKYCVKGQSVWLQYKSVDADSALWI